MSTRISGLAYDVNIPKGDGLPEVEQLLQGSRAISVMFLHILGGKQKKNLAKILLIAAGCVSCEFHVNFFHFPFVLF